MTTLACKGCRATKPAPTGDPADFFPSEHCGDCPPWRCEACGATCSMAAPCGCWIQLADLPHADVKALFAVDGLSLGVPAAADTPGAAR